MYHHTRKRNQFKNEKEEVNDWDVPYNISEPINCEAIVFEGSGWQAKGSVLQRNRYMLEHQLATDVNFIVSNTQNAGKAMKIPAHKYVLISGSEVFWSMFQGDMKEQGDIIVPDIEPLAFQEMLKFLYYDHANITEDLVMHILYASKKYLMPVLTKKCTEYIQANLNADNACTILEQCLFFDDEALKNQSMQIIRGNTSNVMSSQGFTEISHNTLTLILKDDELCINEVDVLKACLKWAEARIKSQDGSSSHGQSLRKQLGDAIFQIRFPLLTIQQFADVAVAAELLTKEEENLCFRYLSQSVKPTIISFNNKPRHTKVQSSSHQTYRGDDYDESHGGYYNQYFDTVYCENDY